MTDTSINSLYVVNTTTNAGLPICYDNYTGPCTSDSLCAVGNYCDYSGFCTLGAAPSSCTADNQCDYGHYCNRSGSCVSGSGNTGSCSTDSTCDYGYYCDNDGSYDNAGLCNNSGLSGGDNTSAACAKDTDCEIGYSCGGNSHCHACAGFIPVGAGPQSIAITPDSSQAYVVNFQDGFNPAGTVSVINTSTNAVSATLTMGMYPSHAALTPNGSTVYVTNNQDVTVSSHQHFHQHGLGEDHGWRRARLDRLHPGWLQSVCAE